MIDSSPLTACFTWNMGVLLPEEASVRESAPHAVALHTLTYCAGTTLSPWLRSIRFQRRLSHKERGTQFDRAAYSLPPSVTKAAPVGSPALATHTGVHPHKPWTGAPTGAAAIVWFYGDTDPPITSRPMDLRTRRSRVRTSYP